MHSLYTQLSSRETPLHCRPTSKKNIYHVGDLYVMHLPVEEQSLREVTGHIIAEERYFKFSSHILEPYAAETWLDYITRHNLETGWAVEATNAKKKPAPDIHLLITDSLQWTTGIDAIRMCTRYLPTIREREPSCTQAMMLCSTSCIVKRG